MAGLTREEQSDLVHNINIKFIPARFFRQLYLFESFMNYAQEGKEYKISILTPDENIDDAKDVLEEMKINFTISTDRGGSQWIKILKKNKQKKEALIFDIRMLDI